MARSGVRKAIFVFVTALGAAFRVVAKACRMPTVPQSAAPRSILVIRLDLLGDVLFTMPAVEALREAYPAARINMITLPYTAPIARLYSAVDEVIEVDSNRIRTLRGLLSSATWRAYSRALKRTRSWRPDLCISMSGRTASLLAFLSGSRRTIGYGAEAYPYMLSHPIPGRRYDEPTHEVEYCLRLARAAGASTRPTRLHLPVPRCRRIAADALLKSVGIGASDRFVAVHPGSINGTAKRWTIQGWGELAAGILETAGVRTVLVGAESDRPLAEQVIEYSGGAAVSLAGRTTVHDLVDVLDRAALVATGDSGPLHLAVALGRPLLCVYGPTDPRVYGPYRPRAPVVIHRKDLPCSPCYTAAAVADCPLGDPICMRLIGVPEMLHSALRLLKQTEHASA